jgi:hypothetical protein
MIDDTSTKFPDIHLERSSLAAIISPSWLYSCLGVALGENMLRTFCGVRYRNIITMSQAG